MKSHNLGFTLIEVLIAIIVLALGLLGLAGMEASSLASNQSAYNRSQATQMAYDIADRMRANRNVIASYVGNPAVAVCATIVNNQCVSCNSAANACTPAQMATKDLWEWNRSLQALPSGAGEIVAKGATVYGINVSWRDDKNQNSLPVIFRMDFHL
jgi:type IV pilus assembly protein PilV